MMRMVGCIIRMLRRDIIHSYKSEKPQQSVSLLSLGKSQSGYGMHGKYQYSSRDWSSGTAPHTHRPCWILPMRARHGGLLDLGSQ